MKTMDADKIKQWNSIKSHQECSLLLEIYHLISNFDGDFRSKLNHTIVISPVGSAAVGFDIYNDKAILGVNAKLFDLFLEIRWYGINIIKDHPAMFWVADFGNKPKNHPVALRFNMRRARANSLSEFKEAMIVRLNNENMFEPPNTLNSFTLPITIKTKLDWEKI